MLSLPSTSSYLYSCTGRSSCYSCDASSSSIILQRKSQSSRTLVALLSAFILIDFLKVEVPFTAHAPSCLKHKLKLQHKTGFCHILKCQRQLINWTGPTLPLSTCRLSTSPAVGSFWQHSSRLPLSKSVSVG